MRIAIITDNLSSALCHKKLARLGHDVEAYFTTDESYAFAKDHPSSEGIDIRRYQGPPMADLFIVHKDRKVLRELPIQSTILLTDDYFEAEGARMRGYETQENGDVSDRLR